MSADDVTWHERLGHPSRQKTKDMISSGLIPTTVCPINTDSCRVCRTAMPSRRPVPAAAERGGQVTVQVDYMPMGHEEKGFRGEVGTYIFSHRINKIVKAYPTTSANVRDVVSTLDHYLTYIAPYFAEKDTCIQTDAGSQFLVEEWSKRCAVDGIISRTCPVDHQAMNGQVERAQGTLGNVMRALLKTRNPPTRYWPLDIETAGYLLNRTPHSGLQNKMPLEAGTGEKTDAPRTRVFGCLAHIQIPKAQRKGKLSDTAWSGVMVGYSTNSPEWLILDQRTGKIRKGYSVTFNEAESGFKNDERVQWQRPGSLNEDKEPEELPQAEEYHPRYNQDEIRNEDTSVSKTSGVVIHEKCTCMHQKTNCNTWDYAWHYMRQMTQYQDHGNKPYMYPTGKTRWRMKSRSYRL